MIKMFYNFIILFSLLSMQLVNAMENQEFHPFDLVNAMENQRFHPFDLDRLGQVNFHRKFITYRIYPNVLWEIENFDKPNAEYKRKVWDCPQINVYKLSEEEIVMFHEAIEAQKLINNQLDKKLETLKKPLANYHAVDFLAYMAVGVLQKEFAITTSKSRQPILGTYGAGSCLIVAIYDHKSGLALLAHIDSLTELNSLKVAIKEFDPEHSMVHLFGGADRSKKMVMDVVLIFEEMNFKFANTDIVRPLSDDDDSSKEGDDSSKKMVEEMNFNEPASLAIDARTGKIFSPVEPKELSTENQEFRMQQASSIIDKIDLIKIYDGRNDLDFDRNFRLFVKTFLFYAIWHKAN